MRKCTYVICNRKCGVPVAVRPVADELIAETKGRLLLLFRLRCQKVFDICRSPEESNFQISAPTVSAETCTKAAPSATIHRQYISWYHAYYNTIICDSSIWWHIHRHHHTEQHPQTTKQNHKNKLRRWWKEAKRICGKGWWCHGHRDGYNLQHVALMPHSLVFWTSTSVALLHTMAVVSTETVISLRTPVPAAIILLWTAICAMQLCWY